ncbi:uncharacterized protein LOC100203949 isoform X5 [Hydra vulgaris]|uniref:Uncharacterized protein LOC100203949 isoform X5 n=2 Tax=Hydra vulgaris TaxID=6087 RepID=A0ABM4DG36_HYDVU
MLKSFLLITILYLFVEFKKAEPYNWFVDNILTTPVEEKNLTVLPALEKEYFFSFEYYPNKFPSLGSLFNVIRFTNRFGFSFGPSVNLVSRGYLQICIFNGFEVRCFNTNSILLEQWIKIDIIQELKNEIYQFGIKLNGTNVHSGINYRPEQFENVTIYALDPMFPSTNYIKNILVVNGNATQANKSFITVTTKSLTTMNVELATTITITKTESTKIQTKTTVNAITPTKSATTKTEPTTTNTNEILTSKDSYGPSYFCPSYYYVLNKSSFLPIENIKDSKIAFTGKGDGRLTFPLATTTINLRTFNRSCFNDFSQCKNGMTISFWFNLLDEKSNSEYKNKFELLTFDGDSNDQVKVWFTFVDGQLYFNSEMSISGSTIANAKDKISFKNWYYVVLLYSDEDGMAVYLNTYELETTNTGFTHNEAANTYITIVLGMFQREMDSSKSLNLDISVDKVAVCEKRLTKDEIKAIYFRDIGIVSLLTCKSDDDGLEIKWNASDPNSFEQFVSYELRWWSESNKYNTNIANIYNIKDIELFRIEVFEPNVLYNVNLTAISLQGFPLNYSYQKNFCQTGMMKRSKLSISFTDKSVSIIWNKSPPEEIYSFHIFYETINSSVVSNEEKVWTSTLNHTIFGLKPATSYKLNIHRYGYGATIRAIRFFETLPGVLTPTSLPKSTNFLDITKTQPLIKYCKREIFRVIDWPMTFSGKTISLSCPGISIGNATRSCVEELWQQPDMNDCKSKNTFLKTTELKSSTDVSKESERLSIYVLTNNNMQFGNDLVNVIDAVESLVKSSQIVNQQQISNFSQTVLNITSHLLDKESSMFWNDLTQEKRSKDAIKLLKATDELIETSVKLNSTSKIILSENIVVNVQQLLPTKNVVRCVENEVVVPKTLLEEDKKYVVIVASFNRFNELIGVPESKLEESNLIKSTQLKLNSKVLSVSLLPRRTLPSGSSIVIVQKLDQPSIGTPYCVYLEHLNSFKSLWSDKGCVVDKFNSSHVTCRCSHLTNFAILMSVTNHNLSSSHKMVMSRITVFGLSVSLMALLLSFFSFVFIKTIKSIRNTIHKNIVFGLFMAELIFIFGVDKVENRIGCQVIAVFLHYFFLSTFFLMAFEGVVLYFMLVHVFGMHGKTSNHVYKHVIACWVLPVLVVIINLAIDQKAYGKHKDHCWLSVKNGFIWSFVGPVLFVIMINIIIFFTSLRVVSKKAKKRSSDVAKLWYWIKTSCLLLCFLGITWVIGIFYINSKSIFFGYMFTVVNSLQGCFIFLFHCVFDVRVRKAWYEFFCCKISGKDSFKMSRSSALTLSSFFLSRRSKQSLISSKKIKKSEDALEDSNPDAVHLTANSKC